MVLGVCVCGCVCVCGGGGGFTKTNDRTSECRARSDYMYVQADLALHSLENKSMVTNSKVRTILVHNFQRGKHGGCRKIIFVQLFYLKSMHS